MNGKESILLQTSTLLTTSLSPLVFALAVIVEFSLSLMESLVAASIANREERYMV
jgi:hypothetical protein